MRVVQRTGALEDDVHHLVQWRALALAPAQGQQGFTVYVLHDDVAQRIFGAGVVERDDVRVLQHAGGAGFGKEAAVVTLGAAVAAIAERDLHRHVALHEGVEALVHHAAGAAADLAADFVLADLLGHPDFAVVRGRG